ncbi:hypothetical protein N2599_11295 [Rhizobium sullae]|uniref:ApeA N-terminal domain-containing protein n=1 Tax=Rhizobium sullae TaxID=50338 RepID=A0ABY5XDZ2_RHISU|nr:hypothetical protein [Rhizobium sullae]UWU12764.1 hypothetical protein N2599_11295 [Rhizobium sullae]
MDNSFYSNRLSNNHLRRYASGMERLYLPETVKRTGDKKAIEGRRNKLDDRWVIETDDPTKKRDTEVTILFDGFVDYGGIRLNHPSLSLDRLNKKTIILHKLGVGFDSEPLSARICLEFSGAYDWFIRWRNGRGIYYNHGLVQSDFDNFCELLATNDILNLVPFEERLDNLFSEFKRETKVLSDLTAASDDPDFFDWALMAGWIGVTNLALSSSARFQHALLERLAKVKDTHSRRIQRCLAAKTVNVRDPKTENTVMRYLTVWRTIYALSEKHVLETNGIENDVFHGRSVGSIAAEVAREADRTRTLHPDDFFRILQKATHWMLNYADFIIGAAELVLNFKPTGDKISRVRAYRITPHWLRERSYSKEQWLVVRQHRADQLS